MINIFHFAEYEYFFFLVGGDLFIALEVVAGSIIVARGQQYAFSTAGWVAALLEGCSRLRGLCEDVEVKGQRRS
jgi:hypothetical protein